MELIRQNPSHTWKSSCSFVCTRMSAISQISTVYAVRLELKSSALKKKKNVSNTIGVFCLVSSVQTDFNIKYRP